jgi:hypothetical protein
MSTKCVITDGHGTNGSAQVLSKDGQTGLVTYYIDRFDRKPTFLPLINSDFGNAINQDASAGGTPINVHDGIDNVYWTGSNIVGSDVTFNSTDRASSGTQSVRANSPNSNDVWQFDKGSTQDLTNYSSLTMQVNVNRRWTAGDSVSIYGWDTNTSQQVGDKVLLEDYITELDFDVWQSAVIPLSDMGLSASTIYAFRMQIESVNGQSPDFFLDEIQIQETGSPIEFKTSHTIDKVYEANSFVITFIDAYAGTLTNGAGMIPIPYDQILGETLANGFQLRSVIEGDIDFSTTIKNIGDLIAIGFKITNAGSDGTNSFITLEQDFKVPLTVKGSPEFNYLSIIINDDLTGLLRFNAALRGIER